MARQAESSRELPPNDREMWPGDGSVAATEIVSTDVDGCLDEDDVAQIVEGGLSGVQAARIHAHIDRCAACLEWFAAVASGVPAAADDDLRRPAGTAWPAGAKPAANESPRSSRYVLLHILGRGGIGVVYSAYDTKLERKVAIKFRRPNKLWASEDQQRCILREAQTMARLRHPNIVSVYDVEWEGDELCVICELIEGSTLRQWLREADRSWRDVLRVFLQAGRGLAAAHAAGVVHRDFKPDNVLIGRDGRVLVGDFGLARSVRPLSDAEPSEHPPESTGQMAQQRENSSTDGLVGTPAYMSPEQLAGKPAAETSDIFAFCVALYEALYGERPFTGSSVAALQESMRAGGRLDASDPRRRVPLWLRRAVLQGLAIDPQARWQSMAALLAALGRDPRAWWIRTAALLAVPLALLAAVAWVTRVAQAPSRLCQGAERHLAGIWDEPRKQQIQRAFAALAHASQKPWLSDVFWMVAQGMDRYAHAWTTMRTQACEATRLTGEQSAELLDLRMRCLDRHLAEFRGLSKLLASPELGWVHDAPNAVQALMRLDDCSDADALQALVPLPRDVAVRNEVTHLRDELAAVRVQQATGRYQLGAEHAAELVNRAHGLGYRPLDAEALELWAEYLGLLGDFAQAVDVLRRALYAAEEGRDRKRAARAWVRLVRLVGHDLGRSEQGLEYARVAEAMIKGLRGDRELEALLAAHLGAVLANQGRDAEAAEQDRRALQLHLDLFGPEHPAVAISTSNVGSGYYGLGRFADALQTYERALTIMGKSLGPHHPQYAQTLQNLASVLLDLGRLDEAGQRAEQARELATAALGSEHVMVASCENLLGRIRFRQQRVAESLPRFERAVTLAEKQRGREHLRVADYLLGLANARLSLGQLDPAREAAHRAAMSYRKSGHERLLAAALATEGEIELKAGQAKQALDHLEDALRLAQTAEALPMDRGEIRWLLAMALSTLGHDPARARSLVLAAQPELRAAGEAGRERLAEAERWLAEHRQ